jgi:hypothetical protein
LKPIPICYTSFKAIDMQNNSLYTNIYPEITPLRVLFCAIAPTPYNSMETTPHAK